MARLKVLFPAFALVALTGCAKVGVPLANLPARFGDTEVIRQVAYGSDGVQMLDIYIPANSRDHKLPVNLFLYGGRWSEGSKEMYGFVGKVFADKGYITVIPDYRQFPEVRFPAFVEDGAKALAWVHENIERYGGDSGQLHVSGHSAGAHIGALIAADERYLRREGKSPAIIRAFAGLAGPYDFVPEAEDLKTIFGPPENYPRMQVTTFIEGDEPPMLLLWGDADRAVWRRNLDLLAARIEDTDGVVETRIYPGVSHLGIIADLTWFYSTDTSVLRDVTDFFERH